MSRPGELWCSLPGTPRDGLVLPVRVGRSGGPTAWQARSADWRRTSRGYYVPAWVDGSKPEQRIVESAVDLPWGGAVMGWAALRWEGGIWFDGLAPDGVTELAVPILIPDHSRRDQRGRAISEERRLPDELHVVDGLVTLVPLRSLTFEMRHAVSTREAVVAFGMAAYSDLVTAQEVATHALVHPGWTGAPQLREAVPHLEENSWSPWEDRTRMIWRIDAELPVLLANRPVFDRYGNHVGTPDLLDEEAGVVIEYDGEGHLADSQRAIDREREARFRRLGLEYLVVSRGDPSSRALLSNRMHEVRAGARFDAPSRRHWTVDLPPWWIPTFTVDQRRNLSAGERAELLRLRLKVS